MKGDFTRFSHQPQRGYAGVLMQQGRVTLDADWNEQFDIDDHRWRVQTVDTIGGACAPAAAAGFGLTLTPDRSDIVISPGRIYVDGILVELHEQTAVAAELVDDTTVTVTDVAPDGRPFAAGHWIEAASVDATSGARTRTVTKIASVAAAEVRLTVDGDLGAHADDELVVRRLTTYLTQPFYPASDPTFGDPFTPQDWEGRSHVVYLDVWRRHVTAVEDPHIREIALGGPDTATRVQTVWALRILRDAVGELVDVPGLTCREDHPAWDALVAPADGRMSARAEAAVDPEDPCAIAPDAGYRSVENRLYRIEIHEPGPLGTATFKWSRDNGSLVTSIVAFEPPDGLRVASLGRDQVRRFGPDDVVEVFTEDSELSGAPGTTTAIVGDPDEAERSFTVDRDVSDYEGGRLPRVRRWDHVGGDPVTTDAWVELEHGLQVRFDGGPFRTGDYWAVPARVPTGDVEGFVDAAPRGVDHHYARLALVTWPGAQTTGRLEDCRTTFPSLCEFDAGCCTISVGDDGDYASLQDAVDAAADIDGPVRICVLPGEHVLPVTVVVRRGDLTISGCGQQSHVFSQRGGVLLLVGVDNVRIEDLWLTSSSLWPTVGALQATRLEVIDCQIANVRTGKDGGEPQPPGEVPPPPAGGPFEPPAGSTEPELDVEVARAIARKAAADVPSRWDARKDPLARLPAGPAVVASRSAGVLVDRCVLVGAPTVTFDGALAWVTDTIARGGGAWIREGSNRVTVRGNTIVGGLGPGVLVGGLLPGEKPSGPIDGVSDVTVADNQIEAMTREGVTSPPQPIGETERVVIAGNTIRACGWVPLSDGLAIGGGVLLRDTTDVRVVDNTIADNGPVEATVALLKVGFGVCAVSCQATEIRGNTITDNGVAGAIEDESLTLNAGVVALGALGTGSAVASIGLRTPAASVHDNQIVVPEGPGVLLHGVGPMSIHDNSVTSTYLGRVQLRFGRAVAVLNLGAAPDVGLLALLGGGQRVVRNFHGRVRIADNQISVQADVRGLPVPSSELDSFKSPAHQLAVGSAVLAASLDDVAITDNQVVNEGLPYENVDRILSTVAAFGVPIRTNGNRVTELPFTTTLSYIGFGIGHLVGDNATTHCIRADGVAVAEHDNLQALCGVAESQRRYRVIVGE